MRDGQWGTHFSVKLSIENIGDTIQTCTKWGIFHSYLLGLFSDPSERCSPVNVVLCNTLPPTDECEYANEARLNETTMLTRRSAPVRNVVALTCTICLQTKSSKTNPWAVSTHWHYALYVGWNNPTLPGISNDGILSTSAYVSVNGMVNLEKTYFDQQTVSKMFSVNNISHCCANTSTITQNDLIFGANCILSLLLMHRTTLNHRFNRNI